MRGSMFWLVLLVVISGACDEVQSTPAQTQVTLTVRTDQALRAKLDSLRATLFVNRAGSWQQRSSVDVPVSDLRPTLDIPILARPGEDESAQLEVRVEAYAKALRLAQTRVVTRFVKGQITSAEASLFACAGHPDGYVCADDGCYGESCTVCSISGDCTPVAPVRAVPQPDAGREAGGDTGTPTSEPSASSDAAAPSVDGSTPVDASTPADAGPPANSCPANACAEPYVCLPTPAGYTCRGQFADWPMPDKTPGAKVAPSYTATPEVVTDNVTKLQWQIGLQRIYPGCTEYVEYANGGKGDPGELCSRAQGKAYCSNLVYAGFDDWRMPSEIELISLYDHSASNGDFALDQRYFADAEYSIFISDSIYAGGPSKVWGVNYYSRYNFFIAGYAGKIRCVREGAVPTFAKPSDRYRVAGDEATDQATGLIWQRTPSPTQYTPMTLATACAAPYRLPTVNELLSLVDFTRSMPAIDPVAFPNTPGADFYAAPNEFNSSVNFATGELNVYEDMAYARCVR
jgi:Protein of unknown function (DUF1566)